MWHGRESFAPLVDADAILLNRAKAICLQPCNPNRYNGQFLIFAIGTTKLRNYELADYLMAVRVLR